jgi:hypothetical protein
MATEILNGKDIALELDISLTDTPDWQVVTCITETDLDTARETIDANSKCGPATLAGTATFTANFTGFFAQVLDAGEISLPSLAVINYEGNGEERHWRLIDTDGGTTYYREFRGALTAFNESSNNNEPVTYTATISIAGNVLLAPTT